MISPAFHSQIVPCRLGTQPKGIGDTGAEGMESTVSLGAA